MTAAASPPVTMNRGWRLALLLGLAALGTPAAAASTDLAAIKARGTLRVIIAADESPDTFAVTPGASPGFERALMDRFAQLHDLRLQVVRAPGYADRIPMLLRGEGDVIAAIFDTPDRRELRSALDDYLANVRRSPSWSRLVVQYFGDQALAVLGRAR
jgi:ABC-type amino acid transport substrate-binding protein